MKTLLSFFVATFLCISTICAQVTDADYVSKWIFPITAWLTSAQPTQGIGNFTSPQAAADTTSVAGFDPQYSDFDASWGLISGNGYSIQNNVYNSAQNKGLTDFSGAFKVFFDDFNMYILIKYTDNSITGNEAIELMCAQDQQINAITDKLGAKTTYPEGAYMRYMAFGGWKATFAFTGYLGNAMMVNYGSDGQGSVNFSGTTSNLNANLFLYNRGATTGAGIVKQVIVIGYPALTGEQRPNFDINSWRALNGGKGMSFDLKIVDTDSDDPTTIPTNLKYSSADYWWSSTSNDGYLTTWFSGFLKPAAKITALNSVTANLKSIFSKTTSNKIELTENSEITVFNSIGKQVLNLKNANSVDLSGLKSGVYMVRAKGQTIKINR